MSATLNCPNCGQKLDEELSFYVFGDGVADMGGEFELQCSGCGSFITGRYGLEAIIAHVDDVKAGERPAIWPVCQCCGEAAPKWIVPQKILSVELPPGKLCDACAEKHADDRRDEWEPIP